MKKILVTLIAITVSMFLGSKTADATSYTLNYSNAFGAGSYGSVNIDDQGDTLKFSVSANESFFNSNSGPGLTWDKFYFNSSLNDITMATSAPGNWGINSNKNVSMFGLFDYELKGTGIGNNPNNPFEFTLASATSLSISDVIGNNSDGWMLAGHLKRFDAIEGQTSTFLAVGGLVGGPPPSPNPVPEPATMLLLGTGLTGLIGTRLRKKNA